MERFQETDIPGCHLIKYFRQEDERGEFRKTYTAAWFNEKPAEMQIKEVYHSYSEPGVFRGFHFQVPPHEHRKLVVCQKGMIQDFVMDIRRSSETYGKTFSFELSEENNLGILIPAGCAHGFYVPDKPALITYMVDSVYTPESDRGILWSTVPCEFPFKDAVCSERDLNFPSFSDFKSPFS